MFLLEAFFFPSVLIKCLLGGEHTFLDYLQRRWLIEKLTHSNFSDEMGVELFTRAYSPVENCTPG